MDKETEITQHEESVIDGFAIGSIAFARYRILDFVAAGGNGRVYKAEDILLRIVVALKLLLGEENNAAEIMRFQSEAKAASRLNHPTIATIYDFGIFDDCPYLSMEFVEGETLEKRLHEEETLSLHSFCSLFLQLSKALSHAHENGVIHRDLKPANVIVRGDARDEELVAKILDFGVAKLIDKDDVNLTPTGNIVGSPLYMSPEQARGERISSQADLYSLGVMMFRSLAGKVPLKSSTAIETIMMVSRVPAPLLESSVPPDVLPPALCELVNKLLSKNPEERPELDSVVIPTLEKIIEENSAQSETEEEGDSRLESDTASSTTQKLSKKFVALVTLILFALSAVGFVVLDPFKKSASEISPDDTVVLKRFSEDEKQIFGEPANTEFVAEKGHLEFTDQKLTDQELAKIAEPQSIISLRANGTQLATLESIQLFPNLTQLSVGRTKVADDALKNLKGLKHLTRLDLQADNITDKAFPIITSLKNLNHLDLSGTHVTPNGLKTLSALPYLRELTLRNSNLASSDLKIFAASLPPDCKLTLAGSQKISEPELQNLSQEFPDLKFDHLDSQVFLANKEMKISDKTPKQLNELLIAKHVYLDLKKQLEKAYGKETLRTRTQLLILGNIEFRIGKPDNLKRAREYYNTALSMAVAAHDGRLESEALDSLVTLGYLTEKYEKTKPLALHAIEVFKREHEKSPNYGKVLGLRYMQLGESAIKAGQPLVAAELFTKAIDVTDVSQGALGCMLAYRGNAYVVGKKYTLGIADHKRALQIFKSTRPDDPSVAQRIYAELAATSHLAAALAELNDLKQALKYNSEFYQLAHRPGIAPIHVNESVFQRIILMQKLKYPESEIQPLRREFDVVQKKILAPNTNGK